MNYAGSVALLLLLNGIFNFAVWPTFFRRVTKDPRARDAAGKPTKFYTVHLVIVSVALLLGAASIVGGVLVLIGVW